MEREELALLLLGHRAAEEPETVPGDELRGALGAGLRRRAREHGGQRGALRHEVRDLLRGAQELLRRLLADLERLGVVREAELRRRVRAQPDAGPRAAELREDVAQAVLELQGGEPPQHRGADLRRLARTAVDDRALLRIVAADVAAACEER